MSGLLETLSGAKGLRAEGKSAQNIVEYQAAVIEQEGVAAKQKAAFAQKRAAKRGAEIQSALTAKVAAAGGVGSPVFAELTAEQAAEIELEDILIGYEGEIAARGLQTEATLARLQGKLYRQRGKAAARKANIDFGMQVGSLLLTGFGGGGGGATGTGTTASGGSVFSRTTTAGKAHRLGR